MMKGDLKILSFHFHALSLDGVYVSKISNPNEVPFFVPNPPFQIEELETLPKTIQKRMVRHLIKRGVWSKDENDPVPDFNGHRYSEESEWVRNKAKK